jgi:hypothetical protein
MEPFTNRNAIACCVMATVTTPARISSGRAAGSRGHRHAH